jgi:hypothetical protein
MKTATGVLLMFAMVGLVAGPAQAHTIAVRGGGGSTDLCGDSGLLGDWTSLEADEDDIEGEETILNNCNENIFSLDLQFSDDGGETLSHLPPFGPVADLNSIFDQLQAVGGGTWRFFSSTGNSICSTESCFIVELIQIQQVIGPNFIFAVTPDGGDPVGFFRIADFNNDPIPEPASLLLLGTGLAGAAWKRRRRADPRL